MNLSSNFNRLSLNKLPVLKQTAKAETQTKEEPVVVQKQATKMPTAAAVTASALEAQGLENMTFISTAKTVESKAATKTQHMTEAEAKEQGYTIIKTAEDLANLSKLSGTKFILMNDIDLSGIKWKGLELKGKEFNGNGFAIKNLEGTQGLFSVASDATISNVTIKNANVKGGYDGAGLLVTKGSGQLNINNCNLEDSNVSGDRYVGGLVGSYKDSKSGDTLNVTNCNAENVNVKSSSEAGGLVGYVSSGGVMISGSKFAGDVEGKLGVGGFIGRIYGSNSANGKQDSVQVTDCSINANVTGSTNVDSIEKVKY